LTAGRPPRVAVVGVRRVRTGLGQFFAKHLVARGAVVPAFVGTRPETVAEGRETLARLGIAARGFTRLEDLLAAEPVDALVVATPHETHLAWLERALAANLHVLCEKPLVWGVDGAAARAAEIVRGFGAKGLLLVENCPWPMTLPAFDALHPGARPASPRAFEMRLSPSAGGVAMLVDSMSHPLSLLQAATGEDEARVEELTFETSDFPAGRLDVSFRFAAGVTRVAALVRLGVVPGQPRPAGYALDGLRAERQVRMSDYSLSFADGGRTVPVPDPMAELVGRFVAALASGVPPEERLREGRRIVARMRMLEEMTFALVRTVGT
jgi:predicted dehydrogenase